MEISLRNQLEGRISAGLISAVITTRSIDRLALKVGDHVHALIKATEVGIEKP